MNIKSTLASTCTAAALILTAVCTPAFAHDGKHPDAPNPSPNSSKAQEVGYEKVSITFGRPGVKDREIWGKLVPFKAEKPKPWVAGANGSTIITFAEDVKINGNDLKAGAYGFFVIPDKNEWTLIFSNNSTKYGIMKYDSKEDALRLTVKPEKADHQEWLDYKFEKTGQLTATLSLHWEKLSAGFTIEAPDHRKK